MPKATNTVSLVNLTSGKFAEIPPTLFNGAVGTQASGINDNNLVCGFWVDANANDHVFSGQLGGPYNTIQVTVADVPAKSAQALGCSNKFIVGSFVTSKGTTHGFITPDEKKFARFDAPGSSQTPAFKVAGTIIKGVNDKGDIVGFFSDGTNVNGFVRFEASVGPQ